MTTVGDWIVFSSLRRSGLLVIGVDALEPADRQRMVDRLLQSMGSLVLVAVDAELPVSERRFPV